MNSSAQTIVDRGRAATRVLAALLVHGKRGKAGLQPDFGWLEGLLQYVESTVRAVHFKAEETFLVKPLERIRPDMRSKLARLRFDYVGAGGYCFRMKEALAFWKQGRSNAVDTYIDNARDHHRSSAAHGVLLRRTILPAAESAFSAAHWRTLEEALANGGPDALAGCSTRAEVEAALCQMMGRPSPPAAALMQIKAAPQPERTVAQR